MTHLLSQVVSDLVTAVVVVVGLRLLGIRVQLEDAQPIWRWRR